MGIHQATKSLAARQSPLSDTLYQLEVLQHPTLSPSGRPTFQSRLDQAGYPVLNPVPTEILQINVGKRCNQACAHCHVDAGPERKEVMSKQTMEQCVDVVRQHQIPVVDITGGAPELHPDFRWLVSACRDAGARVINRCNLTIIVSNPNYHDLPQFFADHQVQVVSSLPHFSKRRTDHQRGEGVFEESIRALRMLNAVGYGQEGTNLLLDLVHNPTGAYLPADQTSMENEYRRQLRRKFNIEFNRLYSITNIPVSRFLEYLLQSGNYESYMQSLIEAFNPATIENLMCRNTISVSWDGFLYDCDFNQMLDLKIRNPSPHIRDFDPASLASRSIAVNQHCYGCTAGAGSSCGGEIAT